MSIQSFSDRATRDFFITGEVDKGVKWANIAKVAQRKLDMVHYAETLKDLKSPPGNRLEALKGDLQGFHSIRINNQWRVIFRWTLKGPSEVKIIDYHR